MLDKLKTRKALFIYGVAALGATALCVLLRTLSLFLAFDTNIGYYKSGAVLPIILNVLTVLAVIAAFAFCFVPKLSIVPNEPHLTKPVRLSAIFPAVGFAAYAFVYFSWLMDYLRFYPTLPLTYVITAIATVGACAFFACAALRKSNGDIVFVLLGILTVVWLVLTLAECYFDTLVQMNSPNKLVFQFACLGGLLLTVNEMRVGLDVKRKGFHLFAASVALLFLFTSSVPSIIGYVAKKMPISYSLLYSDAVFLMLAVFAAVRLAQMCFAEPAPVDEATPEEAQDVSKDEAAESDTVEAPEYPSEESQGENDERE